MLAAGTTLGPYKILVPPGAGGTGEVYLSEDARCHRHAAIKILIPEIAAAVGAERFLCERKTAARLTHPHILPPHDSGAGDGLLFYVMPFVERGLTGRHP